MNGVIISWDFILCVRIVKWFTCRGMNQWISVSPFIHYSLPIFYIVFISHLKDIALRLAEGSGVPKGGWGLRPPFFQNMILQICPKMLKAEGI